MSEIDEYSAPYDIDTHEVSPWPAQPLPVVNASEDAAPEFGSCMTWPVTSSLPVQILPRRIRRHKAKITIVSPTGGTATAVIINSKQDPLTNPVPSGATYPLAAAPSTFNLPNWESQQPLYIIGIGGGVNVSVIDEAYGSR